MVDTNVEEILNEVITDSKSDNNSDSKPFDIPDMDISSLESFLNELAKVKSDLDKTLQNTDSLYEKMQLKALKANLDIVESLIVEYKNLSERIVQLATYYNERGIYDEQALVKAQETINSLYSERLKIKMEIVKSLEKFQKHLLNMEKLHKVDNELSIDNLI